MSKSFDKLKYKAIQIPEMYKWDLYTFLFNLKSVYKEWTNNYILNIKQDFNLEEWTSYIKEILTVPEAFRDEDLFKMWWYKDPNDLTNEEIYNDYASHLSHEIIRELSLFNIKTDVNNIGVIEEEVYIMSEQDEWEIVMYWSMQYIINIDEEKINYIANWLLEKYDEIRKKSIGEFYKSIKKEYDYSSRSDNLIHIDNIDGYSYDKIKYWIFKLFYTNKIKSFKYKGKWFDIEMLNYSSKNINKQLIINLDNRVVTLYNNKKYLITDQQFELLNKFYSWNNVNQNLLSKESKANLDALNKAIFRLNKALDNKLKIKKVRNKYLWYLSKIK